MPEFRNHLKRRVRHLCCKYRLPGHRGSVSQRRYVLRDCHGPTARTTLALADLLSRVIGPSARFNQSAPLSFPKRNVEGQLSFILFQGILTHGSGNVVMTDSVNTGLTPVILLQPIHLPCAHTPLVVSSCGCNTLASQSTSDCGVECAKALVYDRPDSYPPLSHCLNPDASAFLRDRCLWHHQRTRLR